MEKMFRFISDGFGTFFNQKIASADDLPPFAKDLLTQVNAEMFMYGKNPADVRMYTKELTGLKGIYETIATELAPGMFIVDVDNATFAYDNITELDAKAYNGLIDFPSKLINKIPTWGPYIVSALDNFSFNRTQFYDATQKVYKIDFLYNHNSPPDRYPYRKMELEVRMGQYATPKGNLSYGIVATNLKITEQDRDSDTGWRTVEDRKMP